jgi:hypothetical protein
VGCQIAEVASYRMEACLQGSAASGGAFVGHMPLHEADEGTAGRRECLNHTAYDVRRSVDQGGGVAEGRNEAFG